MRSNGAGLSAWLLRHAKWVTALFALLLIASAWWAQQFRIDASSDTLLTQGNRHYIQTQVMNQRFSPREFILIGYETEGDSVLRPEVFKHLRDLSKQILQLERVASVRSLLNVPLLMTQNGSIGGDIDPAQLTIANNKFSKQRLSELFRDHPIYENLIINESQTVTALQILFKPDPQLSQLEQQLTALQQQQLQGSLTTSQQQEKKRLKAQKDRLQRQLDRQRVEEIETLRGWLKQYEGSANLYLGGVHVLGYQLIKIIKSDLMIFGAAVVLVISIALFVIFRHLRWVALALLSCAASTVITVALFALLGLKATVISANFIALQIILTLALVIHLIVQYREFHQQSPQASHFELVQQTLVNKSRPCLFAGLTTSAGFASLLLSNVQPVISFGWMMLLAMAVSILVSLVMFPALLVLSFASKPDSSERLFRRPLNWSNHWVLHHGRWIIAVTLLISAAMLAGIPRLTVENSFLNYFKDDTEVYQELAFIDQELGGSTPMDLVITLPPSERSGNLEMDADRVQALQSIQTQLQDLPGTGKLLSLVNFAALARALNQGKPLTEYELTAIYRLMDEELREDLLGSYYDTEHHQVRLSGRIQETTQDLDRSELLRQIQHIVAQQGIKQENYALTNLFVLYQDILQRLMTSQVLTLSLVFAAVSLMFLLVFRSFKVALIGLLPNLLTTLVLFGIMGWFRIPLDLMTITIASVAMGIAADYTIHYIHRFQREQHRGNDQAVSRSHHSVGFAMFYTSVVIVLGFSMLMFSDFLPSMMFGLLTGVAMIVALIASLTILPVLLHQFL